MYFFFSSLMDIKSETLTLIELIDCLKLLHRCNSYLQRYACRGSQQNDILPKEKKKKIRNDTFRIQKVAFQEIRFAGPDYFYAGNEEGFDKENDRDRRYLPISTVISYKFIVSLIGRSRLRSAWRDASGAYACVYAVGFTKRVFRRVISLIKSTFPTRAG